MSRQFPTLSLVLATLAGATVFGSCTQKAAAPPQSNVTADSAPATAENAAAKEKEGLETGVQAVVYGLPLVIMDGS